MLEIEFSLYKYLSGAVRAHPVFAVRKNMTVFFLLGWGHPKKSQTCCNHFYGPAAEHPDLSRAAPGACCDHCSFPEVLCCGCPDPGHVLQLFRKLKLWQEKEKKIAASL